MAQRTITAWHTTAWRAHTVAPNLDSVKIHKSTPREQVASSPQGTQKPEEEEEEMEEMFQMGPSLEKVEW